MKYVDAFTDISVADVKIDLMRTAYDNDRALLNTFDPRVVLLWTVLFMVVPWLFYETLPLVILLAAAFVLAALSQVSKYLLALLLFGQLTNIGFFVVLVPLIGGVVRAVGYLGDNAGQVVEAALTRDSGVFAEALTPTRSRPDSPTSATNNSLTDLLAGSPLTALVRVIQQVAMERHERPDRVPQFFPAVATPSGLRESPNSSTW